jgi:hypothetical protein
MVRHRLNLQSNDRNRDVAVADVADADVQTLPPTLYGSITLNGFDDTQISIPTIRLPIMALLFVVSINSLQYL